MLFTLPHAMPRSFRLYETVCTATLGLGLLTIMACSESSTPTAVSTVTGVTPSAGNLQVAAVGTTLTDSLTVLVTNASGGGVANVAVGWTPNSAGGSPSTSSVTTNANGIAKIAWTLGARPGTDSMTATVNGISSVFTATATVGAPAHVTPVNYSSVTAAAGSTLPTLTVQVTDQYGNAIPNATVTWGVTAGGGSLTSTTATTNSMGLATTTWTLGTAGSGTVNTVTA
jgi:adhesin/invasin